jgi:hypothetical protein
MTTLAVMKARIADELARSDLTTMIGYAITDAIYAYQSRRFFFNELRDVLFTTADGQEWYDFSDSEYIPDLMAIDSIRVAIDDSFWELCRKTPDELESTEVSPAEGQPTSYTYYNQQIRLYPIPSDTWDVTVSAQIKLAAPVSDDETYNAWMTDAERLIRARAKLNLTRNVNASGIDPGFSPQALIIFGSEETDAFNELKSRTAKQLGTGKIKAYY